MKANKFKNDTNSSGYLNRLVRCSQCCNWDPKSVYSIYEFGLCKLASTGWDATFVAWDDIQAYDPHLLTKPSFGCVEGEIKDGPLNGGIIRCPWGMWDMESGKWTHNENLDMSEKEQFDDNVKNGYLCVCGKMPNMCNCT